MFQIRNKKKLSTIAQMCQNIEAQLGGELKAYQRECIIELLREREFDTVVSCLAQVDFAVASALPQLFALKLNDVDQMVQLGQSISV